MDMNMGAEGGILTLELKDQAALYQAYMPFVKGGGLFVNTARQYSIGDDVFVLLTLLEQSEPIPVAAKVVWVTPKGATSYLPGIGIQLSEDNRELMNRIETQLADQLNSKNLPIPCRQWSGAYL